MKRKWQIGLTALALAVGMARGEGFVQAVARNSAGMVIPPYDFADTNGVKWRAHIFVTNGTLEVVNGGEIDYLVVGGGGGGGGHTGGGGGGGGLRSNVPGSPSGGGAEAEPVYLAPAGFYTVTIGVGGQGAAPGATGSGKQGMASSLTPTFSGPRSVAADGGGGGGGFRQPGLSGGSGGGGGTTWVVTNRHEGGSGTVGQGFDGGIGGPKLSSGENTTAGGGGGAGGAGSGNAGSRVRMPGGAGVWSAITGVNFGYAGGGGGGAGYNTWGDNTATCGGGNGGIGGKDANLPVHAQDGQPNTGGGGGGGGHSNGDLTTGGGTGGSGIVVVRYQIAPPATVFMLR